VIIWSQVSGRRRRNCDRYPLLQERGQYRIARRKFVTNTGTLVASAVFAGESSTGWQQVTFSSPVAITAGTVYVASYFSPTGHYAFDPNFFSTTGVDRVPLHALANGISGANGIYSLSSVSAFPTSTFSSSNYWVDVVFTTTPQPMDPRLPRSRGKRSRGRQHHRADYRHVQRSC